MKIVTCGEFVDLEAPVYMGESQFKRFEDGMTKIFGDRIIVEKIIENKKEMGDVGRRPRKFSDEDQISLADPALTNEELAKSMGKSEFAIQMKRGPFLMALQEWARKKGRTKVTPDDVEEYLKEIR